MSMEPSSLLAMPALKLSPEEVREGSAATVAAAADSVTIDAEELNEEEEADVCCDVDDEPPIIEDADDACDEDYIDDLCGGPDTLDPRQNLLDNKRAISQ